MRKWSHYTVDSEKIGFYEEVFEDVLIMDCHTHLGFDIDRHKMRASGLVKRMDELKIAKTVVFPFNEPGKTNTFAKSNAMIARAYKKYPDKILPFFRLNPNTKWEDEFQKRLDQDFVGLKLHPRSQQFNIKGRKAMKIYARVQEANIPIIFHTGLGMIDVATNVKEILKKFPKLRIILGHSAYTDLDNAVKFFNGKENILFDTSTIKIFDMIRVLKEVDYKQIIFGSDFPYYDQSVALEILVDTAILVGMSPNKVKAILGKNMSRWFKHEKL